MTKGRPSNTIKPLASEIALFEGWVYRILTLISCPPRPCLTIFRSERVRAASLFRSERRPSARKCPAPSAAPALLSGSRAAPSAERPPAPGPLACLSACLTPGRQTGTTLFDGREESPALGDVERDGRALPRSARRLVDAEPPVEDSTWRTLNLRVRECAVAGSSLPAAWLDSAVAGAYAALSAAAKVRRSRLEDRKSRAVPGTRRNPDGLTGRGALDEEVGDWGTFLADAEVAAGALRRPRTTASSTSGGRGGGEGEEEGRPLTPQVPRRMIAYGGGAGVRRSREDAVTGGGGDKNR